MEDTPRRYCMGCGEPVDTHVVERDGQRELRCLYCGLTLKILGSADEEDAQESAPSSSEPEGLPEELVQPIEKGEKKPGAKSIIIAEDSDFLREFMKKLIIKKGLAEDVIACRDGQEFVTEITKSLADDKAPEMAILDLQMPNMDGITAARTMRAVEKKFEVNRKMPILFFSVQRCDEGLKKQLSQFAPASYINKGADASPEKLTHRVDQLIRHLLKKRAQKGGR